MKTYFHRLSSTCFAAALVLSTMSAFPATSVPYTLKTQSSRAASVESIHAMQDNGRILVSGLLRISPAYADSSVGHLCVTVISRDGDVLSDTPVSYNKNLRGRNLSMAQWKVSYVVSIKAPPGSTIIVSHHSSSTSSCKEDHQAS